MKQGVNLSAAVRNKEAETRPFGRVALEMVTQRLMMVNQKTKGKDSKMKNYKEKKEKARQIAIMWQQNFSNNNHSIQYCIEWSNRFYKIGKKYGLLSEFKENAIV